jgi:hypothetical protein
MAAGEGASLTARAKAGIAELFPGYFALVMATGIVSIAAKLLGLQPLARLLLWINVPCYVLLSLLLVSPTCAITAGAPAFLPRSPPRVCSGRSR